MSQYGVIHDRYWTWARQDGLSLGATCLGAYLLSCPHRTILGCYRLPLAYVAEDLGNRSETVSQWFADLSRAGFVHVCENTSFVLLPKYLRWNPPQNPNQRKAIARAALDLPEKFSLYALLLDALTTHCHPLDNGFETVVQTLRERSLNQYQYQYQKEEEASPYGEACSEQSPGGDSSEPDGQERVEAKRKAGRFLGTFRDPEDEAEVWLPLNGGRVFALTRAFLAEKAALYPAVDVPRECLLMREWLENNPRRRKTDRGVLAFVTGWLKKAQDRPSRAQAGQAGAGLPRLAEAVVYCRKHGLEHLGRFCAHHGLSRELYETAVAEALAGPPVLSRAEERAEQRRAKARFVKEHWERGRPGETSAREAQGGET
jgi:hypothetical protein